MINEYGIACLLSTESIELLQENISYLDKINCLHISLFQFNCNNAKILNLLTNFIDQLKISNEFYTTNISRVENNIFLNINDHLSLQIASEKIADFYASISDEIKKLSQINISSLDENKKLLVEKYGIYWIKGYYHPHVTLAYDNFNISNIEAHFPKKIYIEKIGIHPIDKQGRIISI